MRILIVGGRSSLAHALAPVLAQIAEVTTAGRAGCDALLDLSNPAEEIALPDNLDLVINTAAEFGGGGFEAMLQAENVNVLGVLKLCRACTKAGVKRLILISSMFACLDKSSPYYGIYSLSKKHSDEVAQLYSSTFGLSLTILRPSQLYGVGETYRKHQPFLFTIMDKAENGDDIPIYGNNDALRNFIHAEDVARIIALVIQRGVTGTFACMNGENVRYSEVAAAAVHAFGSKSTITFMKDQPDIPDNIFGADDSLNRLIDFYPQVSISLGMKKEAAHRKSRR